MSNIKNKILFNFTIKIIFVFFLLYFYLFNFYSYGIFNADRDADSEERLFTVLTQGGNSDGDILNCTGVLLSDVMVATAAHCLDGKDWIKVFQPGASRDEIIGGEIEVRSGIFFTFLNSYKDSNFGAIDDIGVIILNKPFSNYRIVYLSNNYSLDLILKEDLHALGYGGDEIGKFSKNLKHGIFSYSDSFYSYITKSGVKHIVDKNKEIYTSGVRNNFTNKESSSCEGDSGGPLFYYDNNKPILVGILSGGFGDPCKDNDNNKSYISSWSRVSYYQDLLYLNNELFIKKNNVITYSKSNNSPCAYNYIYSNYFSPGSLWDRCDLKLLNFDIFNLENTVELRVGINRVEYPSFYKSFEKKIKNAKFFDKFELFFFSNMDKYSKNKFDYKLVDNKIYDNKNNFLCDVSSFYTKDGYGFTIKDNCLFRNGSYIIELVYNLDMMYSYDNVSYTTTGIVDIISSSITNYNFIPPFKYPIVNLASKVNISKATPTPTPTPTILNDYKGHCISDYDPITEGYYNIKCSKGKIFKYSFCLKDKSLYLNIYRDELFISSKKVNGDINKSCRKHSKNYSYSISGEVLDDSVLWFIFMNNSGEEYIKVLYAN